MKLVDEKARSRSHLTRSTEAKSPPIRQLLSSVLTITLLSLACSQISQFIPGVTIRAPAEGDTLFIGEPFRVLADSDLDAPQYSISLFEIVLSDRASEFAVVWNLETNSAQGPHIIDEFFFVPPDAPPSEKYALTVTVRPGNSSDQSSPAIGDTITVQVALP